MIPERECCGQPMEPLMLMLEHKQPSEDGSLGIASACLRCKVNSEHRFNELSQEEINEIVQLPMVPVEFARDP
jgi:hypothetical protein